MNVNYSNEKWNKLIRILKIAEAVLMVITLIAGVTAVCISDTASKNEKQYRQENDSRKVQQTDQSAEFSGNREEIFEESVSGPSKAGEQDDDSSAQIRKLLADMTLEEKIMQMFVIVPEELVDHAANTVTEAGNITKNALDQYQVGGVFFSAQNLENPEQVRSMLENMQKYSMESSGIPLFLSLDEEGGTVVRIADNSAFGVMNVGDMRAVESAEDAYKAGFYIGSYLSELGFNLDFAPVADVITNRENTVVKKRSFGSNPAEVSGDVLAFIKGLHENHMLGCMKHFPGHGGTAADSHNGEAISDRTLEELRSSELVPFRDGINAGVQVIMAGHITIPEITHEEPASLSKAAVGDLLRKEMGFSGIVITDAMNMQAVTNGSSPADTAVKAVKAGVDMILLPVNFKEAYEAIRDAVKSGEIAEERIDQSVIRILTVKKNSLIW